MKAAVLVNPGLESLAQIELQELLGVKSTINGALLSFTVKTKRELEQLATKAQAIRRIILPLATIENDQMAFSEFPATDFLPELFSFKIEVENVKGQDNRQQILKRFVPNFYDWLEKKELLGTLEYKNPQFLFIIFNLGKKMVLGLDFTGRELNSRAYRLFPHAASFKGDLAYFFVRKSGMVPQDRIMIGFCKDGAMAIEAELFSSQAQVHAFDLSQLNLNAARKNAAVAKVKIKVQKCALDELELHQEEHSFQRFILQVTQKDEGQLNEIYYQAEYLLKPGGVLLLIGRKNWDVSISDRFKLLENAEIAWGENSYRYWKLCKI